MKYKLQGPFKPWRSEVAGWYILDGAGLCCLKVISPDATETGAKALCKQAAAALNREEARKATPTYSGWEGLNAPGGRHVITFHGEPVDDITVINLLNKLGATLPKRRPTRKVSER